MLRGNDHEVATAIKDCIYKMMPRAAEPEETVLKIKTPSFNVYKS